MTNQITDAITALQNGDSALFKDSIRDVLMTKAMDAIQVQKISAGQAFFNQSNDSQDNEVDSDEEV